MVNLVVVRVAARAEWAMTMLSRVATSVSGKPPGSRGSAGGYVEGGKGGGGADQTGCDAYQTTRGGA
jgi:hypothetical protein